MTIIPSKRLILLAALPAPLFLMGSIFGFCALVAVIYLVILFIYCCVDIAFLPKIHKMRIERLVPEKISIGVSTSIIIKVENLSGRYVQFQFADNLPSHMSPEPESLKVGIRSGEVKDLEYRLIAKRRGKFDISESFYRIQLKTGLFARQGKMDIINEYLVYPNLTLVKQCELLAKRGLSVDQGLARLRQIGQGTEFESLRKYSIGDDTSKIDWKASARKNNLIVRNFESEHRQNILVAIDVGRATAGEFGGFSRLDYMVNAALLLAYATLRQNDWFSVMTFSDKIVSYLPPVSGVKNIGRVADSLFGVQSNLVESDYSLACRFIGVKNRKRSLLCFMSDLVGIETNGIFISYLTKFAHHHLTMTVTLSDSEIERTATESLSDTSDIYAKAIAMDVMHTRKSALNYLRKKGIGILDVPPHKLTTELVSRYIQLKSSRML